MTAKKITKRIKKKVAKKGMVTAYALIAGSIAVILLLGLVVFVASNQRQSQDESARQQAIQAAESGIYFYSWYLAHNLNGKNAQQIKAFWQSGNPYGVAEPYEQPVENFEGVAYGKYKIEVQQPDPGSTIVLVKSTGWTYKHPQIKRVVQVRFRRPSWSEYSVLANDVMRFGSGTTVYGPIHSNNGIRFDGVANNLVTSSVVTYRDPDTGQTKPGVWTSNANENEVFLAGKKYPVPAIDFNGVTADLSFMKEQAELSGIYLAEEVYVKTVCIWRVGRRWCGGNFWCESCENEEYPIEGYHLTLRTDDKIEVRRVLDYQGDNSHEPDTYKITEETEPVVMDWPGNKLVYVNNYVWVDGQIDTAQLTIAAAKLNSPIDADIYINDDITYTNKDGQDTLGLVAENNILIGLYSQNELEIDAALLAQKGKVGRENYNSNNGQSFKRDKITIYGAIASNQRYGFAWIDPDGDHVSGYNFRDIYFDNNLIYAPPPFFPTGSVYKLDLWEEL